MLPMISRRRDRPPNDMVGDLEENQPFLNINNVDSDHSRSHHNIESSSNEVINDRNDNAANANLNRVRSNLNALRFNLENLEISPFHHLYVILLCCMCCIGGICSFWCFVSIAQIIGLSLAWHKACDVPLQKWLLINLLLPFMFGLAYLSLLLLLHAIPVTYLSATQRHRHRVAIQRVFSNRTEVFVYAVWVLQGYSYTDKSQTCADTAPVLYYVSVLTIWVTTLRLFAQCILQCCMRVCEPAILESLRQNGIDTSNVGNQRNIEQIYRNVLLNNLLRSRGTPEHIIEALPTQIYAEQQAHVDAQSENAELELGVNNNNINNNNSSDARGHENIIRSCPICLAQFEDGERLRVLQCQHAFHTECVDQWLRGHRTCPMCRTDVTAQ